MLLPLTTAASHAAPLYFRFNFKAKNWVDDPDDFPLQFYFAFVKAQLNTGKQEETALCANLNKGAYSAHLPAGDGNNEVLLVKGAVMDKYEGTTKFSKMITVRKPLTPPGTSAATLLTPTAPKPSLMALSIRLAFGFDCLCVGAIG